MNILIATDSFKDALDARSVASAIANGLVAGWSKIKPCPFPLADGGEGTLDVLADHLDLNIHEVKVKDPLFRDRTALLGISRDGSMALIESAQASGLQLLAPGERSALHTSTFGTGQLLIYAYRQKVKRCFVGLGGSATCDGGIGMAGALGYRFLDKNGNELPLTGTSLVDLHQIDRENLALPVGDMEVTAWFDVRNPLFGPNGAAQIFASQKGADKEEVRQLDAGLQNLARFFPGGLAEEPGAGSAGGLGAGLMAFAGAKLVSGIREILQLTSFRKQLSGADLVITGEGKLDAQSIQGKLIDGICQEAASAGVPVIAFCGTLDAGPEDLQKLGLKAAFSILHKPGDLAAQLPGTAVGLEDLAYNFARILKLPG